MIERDFNIYGKSDIGNADDFMEDITEGLVDIIKIANKRNRKFNIKFDFSQFN